MNTINEIKKMIKGGALDSKLSKLYCRAGNNLKPYRERLLKAIDGYSDTFEKAGFSEMFGRADNKPVALFSVPGRTEIGGNHTDHQHGKVLTASVDLDAIACAAQNGTDTINVYSVGYGMISVDISDNAPNPAEYNTTQALIRGVAGEISKLGFDVSGFDAYIISDVPSGSGLSSSACFEVLLGIIINDFFCGNNITPVNIAKIGQRAENIYFGKPSGLLDQMGCCIGGTVTIDFDGEPKYTPVDFSFTEAGYAMVTVDSGADHAGLTDEYAAITKELNAVCSLFGKKYLREIDEDAFYSKFDYIRKSVGDRAVLRAMHVYEENKRVDAQVKALKNEDINAFFDLVKKSGISSWTLLQNVTRSQSSVSQPVAIALAAAEKALNGRGACRIHGGGFAGAIQAFVPVDYLEDFTLRVEALLGRGACRVTYIRPIGATIIAG